MAYRTAEIVTGSAHAPDTLHGMNTAIDGLWRRYIDGQQRSSVDFLEQTHDVGRNVSTEIGQRVGPTSKLRYPARLGSLTCTASA